jgi:hypothetical protein
MKTETFKGVIESAYGKQLSDLGKSPLSFSGSYEAYESITEVRNSRDFPSDEEIVNFVNNKLKAAARQKEMNRVLTNEGIEKPTLETDPQMQLRQIHRALVAAGRSDNEARQIAEATLGVKWA